MATIIHTDRQTDRQAGRGLAAGYTALIFGGSFLLFLTQPMIARMALPRLGGAPAVWNSAMLVYQALLLGGYCYAHAIGRLAVRRQAALHGTVLVAAACWLPIGLRMGDAPTGLSPALWVPWLLVSSIGPLFFAISAQAPLMQRWFLAAEPHGNPYTLYAASNLGSFGGLLAYPLLIEPTMTLSDQSAEWTVAYVVLTASVAMIAVPLIRRAPETRSTAPLTSPRPALSRWAMWVVVAAVPSGLMLSTTAHLTTDIAAMPLLWILPLGLYLLSFSVAFTDDRQWATLIGSTAPALVVLGGGTMFAIASNVAMLSAVLGLLLLFAVSVALHARLYALRPAAERLTEFYVACSVGGVIGGIFCALVAPLVFDWTWEHPLLVLAAAALLPGRAIARSDWLWTTPRARRWGMIAALLLALVSARVLATALPAPLAIGCGLAVIALALSAIGRPVVFPAMVGCAMLGFGGLQAVALSVTDRAHSRSYFGVYTVADSADRHLMFHGTTLHGMQLSTPGEEQTATTYYARQSGIGRAMLAVPALFGPHARIGVVGLGVGTLACYAQPGQQWRFYEIDPHVEAIARDPAHFSFLSRCTPAAPVVIADARLALGRETGRRFDLLTVDAFSSDAVPVHMLTREAFAIYQNRIGADGLLMLNLSNRWIDLLSVVSAEARNNGWHAVYLRYRPDAQDRAKGIGTSVWVAMSRSPATLDQLRRSSPANWQPLPENAAPAWTDDFASILPYFHLGGTSH